MYQHIERILIDDDQDCVILEVKLTPPPTGGNEASCHVGYRSCFYRSVPLGNTEKTRPELRFEESERLFEPTEVYGDAPNPTQL